MQKASFDTSPEDLTAAYRLNLKARLTARRARRNYFVSTVAIGMLAAVSTSIWPFGSPVFAAVIAMIYWLLFLAFVFATAYLRLPRQSRAIYTQQKSLHVTTTVEWNDAGIAFTSAKGQTHFVWDDFTRIDADEKVVLLWQSDAVMNFIPTRVLTPVQLGDITGR
ncbi:YcxB family protein [Novosphingobium profundi]|uniref:YcxB family protein n=1 Tax=Novosphingobium profundi TaxID=1774954 RepID=UPI001BDA02D7|nr:YcxB family protein [Novosphingobium profundi]MBT0669317.1 YcxB family protein [Novosphingobium profundi]